jgi:hypothetical protein
LTIPVAADQQSRASSPLYIVPVDPKNVTASEIVAIHAEQTYLNQPEYAGAYHPIDGWLQRFGLLEPLGYVIWGFGSMPSWVLMILISFFGRQAM